MRLFIAGIAATVITEAVIAVVIWALVLPRLDWSARQKLSAIEQKLATKVLAQWVRRNADSTINPLSPTPSNLMLALKEYEEHCAACHGADGSGRNRFEADFYPPVPNLMHGTQKFSDAELYFIVANGIRDTAMPAFGKYHLPGDIWRTVLWLRHLAQLSTEERLAIARAMQREREQHRKTEEDNGEDSH